METVICKVLGSVLVFTVIQTAAQQIDLVEFTTSLNVDEVTVRQPSSPFIFIKDRTPPLISKRIIGGDIAEPNQYPFQVALYIYINSATYFCGASLITNEWVVTAAHCVEDATSFVLLLGAHNLSAVEDNRITYTSTEYVIHEDWDSYWLRNDVALIKLPEAVTLNSYINTVQLASGSNTYSGDTSRVLGWGVTTLGSVSDVLRYVDAEVMTNEACAAYEEYSSYIVSHHLCTAGNGTVGSCNGDSGGPLLVDGIQVGIVSFGVNDCAASYPSVYTRVTDFYSWINTTIASYQTDETTDDDRIYEPMQAGGIYHTLDFVLGTIVVVFLAATFL